jgi:hypothetical protein
VERTALTGLEAALVEVASFLESADIPYMLIGGLAVALWGEPRATLDVDFSVWADADQFEATVQRIAAAFRTIRDAMDFARKTRVLPIATGNGLRADIVFASLEPERAMIARAAVKTVDGVAVRLAAVEDLIWMKLISERPRDVEDARCLIRRFRAALDRAYLEPKLEEMSEALARPEIVQNYRAELLD